MMKTKDWRQKTGARIWRAGICLILLGRFALGHCAAQTNAAPAAWTTAFTVTPTRPMYAADRAAYARAGGATNASDAAIYAWQHFKIVSNGVTYIQTGWRYAPTNNPDFAQFWWLASMGDRYGFTLPVSPDVAASKIINSAISALDATNLVTAGFIQLDSSSASYIFTARTLHALAAGQGEADWSHVPLEFVPARTPIYEPFP